MSKIFLLIVFSSINLFCLHARPEYHPQAEHFQGVAFPDASGLKHWLRQHEQTLTPEELESYKRQIGSQQKILRWKLQEFYAKMLIFLGTEAFFAALFTFITVISVDDDDFFEWVVLSGFTSGAFLAHTAYTLLKSRSIRRQKRSLKKIQDILDSAIAKRQQDSMAVEPA